MEIKQGDHPGSSYEVMCAFLNGSNLDAVEFKDREYNIIKMVQGQSTVLTSPEWKKAGNIEFVDSRGFVHPTVKP